jgi:hypothetical protein
MLEWKLLARSRLHLPKLWRGLAAISCASESTEAT